VATARSTDQTVKPARTNPPITTRIAPKTSMALEESQRVISSRIRRSSTRAEATGVRVGRSPSRNRAILREFLCWSAPKRRGNRTKRRPSAAKRTGRKSCSRRRVVSRPEKYPSSPEESSRAPKKAAIASHIQPAPRVFASATETASSRTRATVASVSARQRAISSGLAGGGGGSGGGGGGGGG
jgi:uncharacterized membrane protein YgcG